MLSCCRRAPENEGMFRRMKNVSWGTLLRRKFAEFTSTEEKSRILLYGILFIANMTVVTATLTMEKFPPFLTFASLSAAIFVIIEWEKFCMVGTSGFDFREFIAYRIDTFLHHVPGTKAIALVILMIAIVGMSGVITYVVSRTEPSVTEAMWKAVRGIGLDWSFIGIKNKYNYTVRSIALVTNMGGLGVTALLVGLVADGVNHLLDNLRKGTCKIVEKDHTLIIGWNSKALQVVEEVAKAGNHVGGRCIVILADLPKDEVESRILSHQYKCPHSNGRIVCRSGTANFSDLDRASFQFARSIIVLPYEKTSDSDSDVNSIRSVLQTLDAFNEHAQLGNECDPARIVVEVCRSENAEIMDRIGDLIDASVVPVIAQELIGRLLLHSSRFPALAAVWEELLGFDGCEFYMSYWPALEGLRFDRLPLRFRDAIPIGVRTVSGDVIVNPPGEYLVKEGEEIIVLADDEGSYEAFSSEIYSSLSFDSYDLSAQMEKDKVKETPISAQMALMGASSDYVDDTGSCKTRKLFCGWRDDLPNIANAMARFIPQGLDLHVLCKNAAAKQQLFQESENITVTLIEGSPVSRTDLELITMSNFSAIIVAADQSFSSKTAGINVNEEQDTRVIYTLLLLRDIMERQIGKHGKRPLVIAEIVQASARDHVNRCRIATSVVSSTQLVSKALALVVENPDVNLILTDLFDGRENELRLLKANALDMPDKKLNFYEVMLFGGRMGMTVLGYKEAEKICLNPENKIAKRHWGADLELIVIECIERLNVLSPTTTNEYD